MKNAAEFNNSAAFFMLVMHGQGLRNYLQKYSQPLIDS